MTGAYCKPWCIYCRRRPGIDCTDFGRTPRWRRRIEGREWRRYAGLAMAEEAYAEDAENDPETDCQHGCNGMCELRGSERCTFLCHPPFEEMFGDKYD